MNLNKPKNHVIDYFFILGLFFVFTATALVVVLIGVNVYEATVANMNENYTSRTALTYVGEKIRQNDSSGTISVGEIQGSDALIIEKNVNSVPYLIYIYAYDGKLKELFIKKDQSFIPGDGDTIMDVAYFNVSQQSNNLIKIETTDSNGKTLETFINLHSAS